MPWEAAYVLLFDKMAKYKTVHTVRFQVSKMQMHKKYRKELLKKEY